MAEVGHKDRNEDHRAKLLRVFGGEAFVRIGEGKFRPMGYTSTAGEYKVGHNVQAERTQSKCQNLLFRWQLVPVLRLSSYAPRAH